MHRVDNDRASAVIPTPEAVGTPGYFTLGDPLNGIPASTLPADWCNAVQEELAGLVEGHGIPLDKTANDQLGAALGRRGWLLSQFAGADADTQLENALLTLDHREEIIIPAQEDWLIFEGNHVIDLSSASGRDIYLDNRAPLRFSGTGYFLTIKNADNTGTSQTMARGVVKNLYLAPDPDSHWGNSGGIRIQNCVHTILINPRIFRFGLAGVNLHNLRTNGANVWTEQTRIVGGYIAGNRINVLGDQDTAYGDPAVYKRSQRGTQILGTWLSPSWNPGGDDWPTEQSVGEDSERHVLVQIEDVSWYHGHFYFGMGLKRNNSTGIYMKGGSASGAYWHVEGESQKGTYTGVRGLHLETTEIGQPRFSGCTGSITIISIGDGAVDEDEDTETTSVPILDERTGLTSAAAEFGDLRLRGSFFFEPPQPDNGVVYRLLPGESALSDANDVTITLDGWMATDNTIQGEEWVVHDKDGGFKDWEKQIFAPTLRLSTNAYGTDVPAGVECLVYNQNQKSVTALSEDAGVYYIDIGEDHSNVIRLYLDATAKLHQVRGGRPGQRLTIFSLNSYPIIAHAGVAADGQFQLIGDKDWYASGTYAARHFEYVYHAAAGWFWLDVGGTPSDTGEANQSRESYWTSDQLKTLRAKTRTLIAAPGPGYAVVPTGIQFWFDAGNTGYTVAGDNDIEIRYTDGSGHLFYTLECTGFLNQTTDQFRFCYPASTEVVPVENAAIIATMAGAAEIADGNGTLRFRAFYRRLKLGWPV